MALALRETGEIGKKSLRVLTVNYPDWDELPKDGVAFANAVGGRILIGIEAETIVPSPSQKVPGTLVENLTKRISAVLHVGIVARKLAAENGGDYIEFTVCGSALTLASLSDWTRFIRVYGESRTVLPNGMGRLMVDKNAFVWEGQPIQPLSLGVNAILANSAASEN